MSFKSDEEANAAIEKLNGYQANHGCSFRVSKPREKSLSMPATMSKVHVMNIPLQMTQVCNVPCYAHSQNLTFLFVPALEFHDTIDI